MAGAEGWRRAGAVWAALAVGIAAFYLSVYAIRGFDQPVGYDTARYLWRTNCVAAGGLDELRSCAGPDPSARPARVAYPLVSLFTTAAIPMSRSTFAAVLPAVLAGAIAIAAAALVSSTLEHGVARLSVLAVVVGASPMVVAMAAPEGYVDMMISVALATAGLLAAVSAALGRPGAAAAAALLAAAALVHPPTAVVFGTVVLGLALAPLLVRGLPHELTGRVLRVLGAGVALWALLVAGLVRAIETFHVPVADLEEKFRSHLPRLGLPVGIPAAAVGVATLRRPGGPGRPASRSLLLVALGTWLAVIAFAVAAWFVGWKLPVHRFLILALPVPLLGGLALLRLGDLLSMRRPRWGRAAVAAGCVVVVAVGAVLWNRNAPPLLVTARLRAAASAVPYLRAVLAPGTRASVVADAEGATLDELRQTFRAAIPPDLIARVRFLDEGAGDAVRSGGIVLAVRGFTRGYDALVEATRGPQVGPDVLVLRGPPPSSVPAPAPVPRLEVGWAGLVVLAVASLLLLLVLGAGWSEAALRPTLRPLERLAAAVPLGLAVVLAAGLVSDLAGLRVGGPGNLVIAALLASAGVVATRARDARGRWSGDGTAQG